MIQTGGNMGFGAGVNAAVRACETPLILVTNPDTLPETPSSLPALLGFHREGTLSGAALLDGAGNLAASGGRWPTVQWVAAQVFRRARPLWNGLPPNWIQGALILAERSLFISELGGFHRDYPLYFEDVDLCARAHARSVETRFCEGARFVHREGTGAPPAGAVRLACFHWGMWKWFDLNRPGLSGTVRWLVMLKCLVRMSVFPASSPERQGYALALTALRSRISPTLPSL